MGGSTEGITSGLDAPDINKRQPLIVGGGADARYFISRATNMPSLKTDTPPDDADPTVTAGATDTTGAGGDAGVGAAPGGATDPEA